MELNTINRPPPVRELGPLDCRWEPRTRRDLAEVARVVQPTRVALLLWTEWALWPLGVRSEKTAAVVLWLVLTAAIFASAALTGRIIF